MRHSVKLRGFTAPNFAVRESDKPEGDDRMSFPLSELEPETLAELCDDFRRAVFLKAGKKDPSPRHSTSVGHSERTPACADRFQGAVCDLVKGHEGRHSCLLFWRSGAVGFVEGGEG